MLTDEEIRTLGIELLTLPTARDLQRRVGASDLGDSCDFCLATKLAGGTRETALSRKTWLGRTLGTAAHGLIEDRIGTALMGRLANLEGAEVEKHVWFGELGDYGQVGGSIDLLLPEQLVDWKGSTRKKSAYMQDYLQSLGNFRVGLKPRFEKQKSGYKLTLETGVTFQVSDRVYADEMAKQVTKVTKYYAQATLYMKGSGRKRASLYFINRDGTGYFDVPTEAGYDDPARVHDVWVLSFDYNPDYAEAVLARGRHIFDALQSGSVPADFARHKHCFVCSNETVDVLPDIEVSFGVAA